MGFLFRLFILLPVFAMTVGGVVVLVVLAFAGGATLSTCGSERVSTDLGDSVGRLVLAEPARAATFQQKWDQFNTTLDNGSAASASFDESELTARAVIYMDGRDAPLEDIVICVHDGYGEGSAKVSVPFFGDADVKVSGTVDFSGATPKVEILDIDVGKAPDFIADRFKGRVQAMIDDQLDGLELDHTYSLELLAGQATVNGSPRPAAADSLGTAPAAR